jgi:ComF family protein
MRASITIEMPIPKNASPITHRVMRSTSRSVAIGGIADDSLTGTVPPYFTRHDIDRLSDSPYLSTAPFLVIALGPYRGELRRAVHQMKFRNARWIAARFGRNLARVIGSQFGGWRADVVTWAPTTSKRVRRRGVDQSAIIASNVARTLRVRRMRLLRRLDDNTQTGASREIRRRGPRYKVRSNAVLGRRILLVDDVMTTGTTLARARDALLAEGALEVRCAVIARVMRTNPGVSARVG